MIETETTTGNSGQYTVTMSRTYKNYEVPKLMRKGFLRKLFTLYTIIHFDLFVWPNIPNRDAIVYMNTTTL